MQVENKNIMIIVREKKHINDKYKLKFF